MSESILQRSDHRTRRFPYGSAYSTQVTQILRIYADLGIAEYKDLPKIHPTRVPIERFFRSEKERYYAENKV